MPNIRFIDSGTPVGDVNNEECMQYAIINNKEFSNLNNTSNPAGCFIHTGNNPSNVFLGLMLVNLFFPKDLPHI